MALATKIKIKVPQPPIVKDGVQLQLSFNEATTLAILLAKVSGAPRSTRRRYADSISQALRAVGFGWNYQLIRDSIGAPPAPGIIFIQEIVDPRGD